MPKNQPTLAELVQVLDNGMTLYDILLDLGWAKKQKTFLKEKEKKRYQIKKQKKIAASLVEREKQKLNAETEAQVEVSGSEEATGEN